MLTTTLIITILVVIAALVFDFINGFHDASNSIATIVATKVLKPRHAVAWAAFFNFAALFVFGTGVAKTVGSGMIALDSVTPTVVLAGLLGAIIWGILTWYYGLPSSSSHALLGGYAGSAMMNSVLNHGIDALWQPIIPAGWEKTILFILLAPVLGLILAVTLMKLTNFIQKRLSRPKGDKVFGGMQLLSSAFLSLMHGGNDAQKTAGIITGALVASGALGQFEVPYWVLFISYATISLGTLFGGWRIVDTMGRKLTRIRPHGGFCAETAAALSILLATSLKLPVSTTHVTTGSILGVGLARRPGSVRLSVAKNIAIAWVTTLPATAILGGVLFILLAGVSN